jgi:hypothetical protein
LDEKNLERKMQHTLNYGNASVNTACIEFIKSILNKGKIILELGSGPGSTVILSDTYRLYSVENQPEWFDQYPLCTTYINCRTKYYDEEYTAPDIPNQKGWYHPDDIFPNLPKHYDLILIDGPGGAPYGRGGFFKHIDKFNTDVPMVFDDIHHPNKGGEIIKKVSEYVGRPYKILETDPKRHIGYIL